MAIKAEEENNKWQTQAKHKSDGKEDYRAQNAC